MQIMDRCAINLGWTLGLMVLVKSVNTVIGWTTNEMWLGM